MKVSRLKIAFGLVTVTILAALFIFGGNESLVKASSKYPQTVQVGNQKYNYNVKAGEQLTKYFADEGYHFEGL